jgi:multiple sugar transport system permease protein
VSGRTSREGGRREEAAARLFLAPALGLIAVFFVLPVFMGLLLSFTDFDIYAIGDPSTSRVVGFANYAAILSNPLFWKALGNTVWFVVVAGPLSVAVSLVAALLVHAKATRLRTFFRTVYFVPVVTTLVAVAIVFRYLEHPKYGLVNYALGFLGVPPIDWLGDPRFSMPAIVILTVWKNFGYNMLILLAGLANIPDEQYEAARLDGAGPLAQFIHVTLPGLAPTFFFVAVITMLGYFQLFAEPYVMTQGGPLRSTTTVVLLMYEEGFRWWRMGMSAAIAFVLFLVMLVGTWIQLRVNPERAS